MQRLGAVKAVPMLDAVAAVSCGVINGVPMLDLDYAEDSSAEADANFVVTGSGQLVEVQATAEKAPFPEATFMAMLGLARAGTKQLFERQRAALGPG
jgi:ribonuclease PH